MVCPIFCPPPPIVDSFPTSVPPPSFEREPVYQISSFSLLFVSCSSFSPTNFPARFFSGLFDPFFFLTSDGFRLVFTSFFSLPDCNGQGSDPAPGHPCPPLSQRRLKFVMFLLDFPDAVMCWPTLGLLLPFRTIFFFPWFAISCSKP